MKAWGANYRLSNTITMQYNYVFVFKLNVDQNKMVVKEQKLQFA